jgi:hypothetical protein
VPGCSSTLSTVKDRKQEYTKKEYCNAVLARKVQNIIMFPRVCKYTKIVDSKLITNCPVEWADILAAERIFGTNLRALKGKIMHQLGIPVLGQIKGMPPTILE